MLRHKRALHKYSRATLEDEFLSDFSDISRNISFVVGQDGDDYVCVMRDGSVEFQELPKDHEKVAHFVSLVKKKHGCEIIEDVKNWVSQ